MGVVNYIAQDLTRFEALDSQASLHLERLGENIIELPVTLAPTNRASTVRPLRHGTSMCLALVRGTMRGGRVPPALDRRL